MATATPTGAEEVTGIDSAADEFYRRLTTDADELSEGDNEEENEEVDEGSDRSGPESDDDGDDEESGSETDEASEDSEAEDDERGSEGEDDEDEASEDKGVKTVIDSDDAVVKIKVDGEVVEASIKDLKRLYGQEASLTRKSQEAATLRKQAEEAGAYHVAGLEVMLQKARAAAEPYANLNFLALAKDPNITQEELSALSEAAKRTFEDVRFLESELDGVINYTKAQRHQMLVNQAKETHKVLSDPKQGIEGWSEPLYNDIRNFAVGQGLPQQIVDEIVDPVGIKILHMAMQYAKGKKAVTGKGPKKVDKSPKRIVKGVTAETAQKHKTTSKDSAIKKLQKSGSFDDAAEAFLARWRD